MKRISLPFLVLFLLLSSCGYEQPEIVNVENFRFGGYNHLNKSLIVQYDPVVHNPNPFSFFIDKVETEILIDGIHVGNADSDKRIDIAANDDSRFTLNQKVQVKNFIKTIKGFIKKDSVKVEIVGKYHFKGKNLEYAHPYTYESFINPKKELTGFLLGL